MEALEEPTVQYDVDSVKGNSVIEGEADPAAESTLCFPSNGVAESTTHIEATETEYAEVGNVDGTDQQVHDAALAPVTIETVVQTSSEQLQHPDNAIPHAIEEDILAAMETEAAVESLLGNDKQSEEIAEEIVDNTEAIICNEVTIEGCASMIDNIDASNDKVTLRTEVVIEKSDDDIQDPTEIISNDHDTTNNILNDLGQGIELSEALRSSDTADNVENNNDTTRGEVFNKEELLDILEGNDNEESDTANEEQIKIRKGLEAQIALNQLSRLSLQRKRKSPVKPNSNTQKKQKKTRKNEKKDLKNIDTTKENKIANEKEEDASEDKHVTKEEKPNDKSNESIVNTLVKDWDDDEPSEADQGGNELLEQSETLLKATEQLVKSQIPSKKGIAHSDRKSVESPTTESQPNKQTKSGDENQPQRRLGRVIKKKVPFDPDNPDTFTKSKEKDKVITKIKDPQLKELQSKEPQAKESQPEKEQSPAKKIKQEQTPKESPRPKSKSPVGKMQWKKPTCKNSNKNNKRLSEVDKLLMDEGAVNMIYQLTPEAPKGKKNMRTKAEFIKKIQSSTPDSKEMKFRERKREVKSEEGEPKKILGGKSSRSSLSGSVKSPSAAEDFETHSADDSIIYRRHSSSSYSSACMSPRRLSDVESGANQNSKAPQTTVQNQTVQETVKPDKPADIFVAENSSTASESINKDDYMSIKEKLNTKLSLALNKRKREITAKTEKPPKQKRVTKVLASVKDDTVKSVNIDKFKHVSICFEQRLAEVCIRKIGPGFNIEMIKELEEALKFVDSRKDISVMLLTSECGSLCSSLDLRPILAENMEIRTNYGHSIAEAVRSLQSTVEKHSKLVVSGVWGACTGVALALIALSDVALASEHASFCISASLPLPGAATLTARCSRLSHSLISDLVVFGKSLSATEALQGGLVHRSVPGAGPELIKAVARELASKPAQSIVLKKQLLKLNRNIESESTFQIGLEKERDLLVEYWTSMEGQDMIRSHYHS